MLALAGCKTLGLVLGDKLHSNRQGEVSVCISINSSHNVNFNQTVQLWQTHCPYYIHFKYTILQHNIIVKYITVVR